MRLNWLACFSLLFVSPTIWVAAADRHLAEPLPGHPGNVYLKGEKVTVPIPAGVVQWRASDLDGLVVGQGQVGPGEQRIRLGSLPIGWYRIDMGDTLRTAEAWTTAAVIARPSAPPHPDSPVCVDSATSWFSRPFRGSEVAKQEAFANLAALAGVNWIRDRLSWEHLETKPGQFAQETLYDSSASLQAKQGLQVLQVFHSTPGWAVDRAFDGQRAGQRFARDLRVHHAFCKAMAQRFKRRVAGVGTMERGQHRALWRTHHRRDVQHAEGGLSRL